jgi:hypothetical protein
MQLFTSWIQHYLYTRQRSVTTDELTEMGNLAGIWGTEYQEFCKVHNLHQTGAAGATIKAHNWLVELQFYIPELGATPNFSASTLEQTHKVLVLSA